MKIVRIIFLGGFVTILIGSCVVNRKSVGTTTVPKKEPWKAQKQVCPTCGDKQKKSSIFE